MRQALSNKVEHWLDSAKLRRAAQLPNQLHLSVTDRCFLPCKHCDIWKNEATDLETDIWEGLITRLGEWCAPASMNFVGGEPLLRRDLPQLMHHATQFGFTVSFNTNGWLVNAQNAQSICDAGASIVYVSMDGFTAETVDYSRGKEGSFDKSMEAIDIFDKLPNPRVIIACILHAQNAHEILSLLNWVESRNMQLVIQPLYQNFGNNKYDPHWWKNSEFWPKNKGEVDSLNAVLDALTTARIRGRPICNEAAQLQAMKFHFEHPESDSGLSCRAGHQDLSFDPQGNIRLCYFLEPVGSIFEDVSLSYQWMRLKSLKRRWEVSRCERHCNLLNCNFERE
jgi:MoaA/NifB/PqqE/SkfB family radical SAM enzyme